MQMALTGFAVYDVKTIVGGTKIVPFASRLTIEQGYIYIRIRSLSIPALTLDYAGCRFSLPLSSWAVLFVFIGLRMPQAGS